MMNATEYAAAVLEVKMLASAENLFAVTKSGCSKMIMQRVVKQSWWQSKWKPMG